MSGDRYIYRIEPRGNGAAPPDGVVFEALTRPWHGAEHFHVLQMEFGWTEALKTLLKLLSGSRFLFVFLQDGRIVSHVWSTEHSPRYPIGRHSCVLGPLATHRAMRRRGLASALLRLAVARLGAHGYREIHIDTVPANVASQRAIQRAGFSLYALVREGQFRLLRPGEALPHAP